MGKALGSTYRVTGSWEKPVVTVVSREAPRQPPPTEPPKADEPSPPPQPASGAGLRRSGL
jgi:hypothetical protein